MNELKKILYVEDDEDIRAIAEITLKDIEGFDLLACSSGLEAVSKIKEFNPQIIILDVMMPEMNGPDTLKKIKSMGFNIPAVFMTAKAQKQEVEHYLSLGVADVITKPFDPTTLGKILRNIWNKINAG